MGYRREKGPRKGKRKPQNKERGVSLWFLHGNQDSVFTANPVGMGAYLYKRTVLVNGAKALQVVLDLMEGAWML